MPQDKRKLRYQGAGDWQAVAQLLGQIEPDIRLRGFDERSSLATAWAWLDRQPLASRVDEVAVGDAGGRLLAEPLSGGAAAHHHRAAADGYAVRAADCDGASPYNPLMLAWLEPCADTLPPGFVCPIASGWTLPVGADAVLPFESAQPAGGRWLEVLAPVAPGTGINIGKHAGPAPLERGRRLRPQDVGYLAGQGIATVKVLRGPAVRVVVPGAKFGGDMLTPMLSALLARDGAIAEPVLPDSADERGLAQALMRAGAGEADVVLIAGRSGAGPDDVAALALREAGGALALHGIALRPGDSTGLGLLGEVPVLLLPGEPFACLATYDMLAARLVRRFAGMGVELPYPVVNVELDRKIASGIGLLDIVPVRLADGLARPIGIESGLAGSVRADGFVVVAEMSEGHAAGARVEVHLYSGMPP